MVPDVQIGEGCPYNAVCSATEPSEMVECRDRSSCGAEDARKCSPTEGALPGTHLVVLLAPNAAAALAVDEAVEQMKARGQLLTRATVVDWPLVVENRAARSDRIGTHGESILPSARSHLTILFSPRRATVWEEA